MALNFLRRLFQKSSDPPSEATAPLTPPTPYLGTYSELFEVDPPPRQFDLRDPMDALRVHEIVDAYSKHLGWAETPHKGCMYRPVSELPYPKEDIRGALEALLLVTTGLVPPPGHYGWYREDAEVTKELRSVLMLLPEWVDVPADRLPTDPTANGEYMLALEQGRDPEEAAAFWLQWKADHDDDEEEPLTREQMVELLREQGSMDFER